MGYFTSIADRAFKVGAGGETLFYLGGPLSRPLVIADDEQRVLTYTKRLWMQRVLLTILILGQPFLFMAFPTVTGKVVGFVAYGAAVMLVNWGIQRIVFRHELGKCRRLRERLPLRNFYAQMGDQHSEDGIIWRLIGCLVFVLCGFGIATSPTEMAPGIGIIGSLYFSACGVGWWFALRLKRAKTQEANKTPHHNPLPAPSRISREQVTSHPESNPRPR